MTSLGLSLKLNQIIAPLKNVKLVVLALVANFMAPIVAYLLILNSANEPKAQLTYESFSEVKNESFRQK